MRENLTLSSIVQEFRTAAEAHLSVESFEAGTLSNISYSYEDKDYPLVYLRPLNVSLVNRERVHTFDLYVLSNTSQDTNEQFIDILSENEMILWDLVAWFNFGTTANQQTFDLTVGRANPASEVFDDKLSGIVAEIKVTTPFLLDYCSYPQ